MSAVIADERQYCTFVLDKMLLGVAVQTVQEVIRYQAMTPVPLAPKVVTGLINLRGQIITAVDLRERLELGPREDSKLPMNVVVRTRDNSAVSLLVDSIGDVVNVSDIDFERPPDTVSGIARELIVGAYKLEGRLLLVLDVERAIDIGGLPVAAQG